MNSPSFMLQVTKESPLLRSLLLLLLTGGALWMYEFQQISEWGSATGKVVARQQAFGSDDPAQQNISVRFSTDERTLHFTTGLNPVEELGLYPSLIPGQEVLVLFNPQQPHMARLDRLPRLYPISGSIALLLVIVLLGTGGVKLLQNR